MLLEGLISVKQQDDNNNNDVGRKGGLDNVPTPCASTQARPHRRARSYLSVSSRWTRGRGYHAALGPRSILSKG